MFLPLIRARRSIRHFAPQSVAPAIIARLAEAALRAPSSRSLNPWEFVFVEDAARLQRLAQAKPHGASFLAKAPLGVVVCADPRRCDVWVEDCAIAVTYIQLAAQTEGLGSCWVQVRRRQHASGIPAAQHVRTVLDLPEHLEVEAMIAIGHPAEHLPPHPPESLLAERIHRNAFGKPLVVDFA
jgi:nitroreductase